MLLVPGSPPLASLSFPSTGSPAGRPEEKPAECLPRQSESMDQQSQSGQNQGSNPGLQKTTMFRTASVTEASGPDCEQLPHNKMNCRVQWGGVHEDKSSDLGNVSFRSGWKYLSVKSPLFPKPHGSTKSSYFSSVCLTHAIYQFVHSVTYKWSLQF